MNIIIVLRHLRQYSFTCSAHYVNYTAGKKIDVRRKGLYYYIGTGIYIT